MNLLPLILLVLSGLPQPTTHAVILTWNEAGTYTAFRIYRKPATQSQYTQIALGVKNTYYADRVPAGEYNYEVRATIDVNSTYLLSDPSEPVTVTVP